MTNEAVLIAQVERHKDGRVTVATANDLSNFLAGKVNTRECKTAADVAKVIVSHAGWAGAEKVEVRTASDFTDWVDEIRAAIEAAGIRILV